MIDDNDMQELPVGWTWTTVGDISERIHYGYTESASESKVGPKFLRITDIQDNAVDWGSVPYCKISDEIKDKYLLKERDIVFARTGATVGKSFLLQGDIPEAVFASYLIRIVLHKNVDEKFVAYFFNSHLYWSQVHANKVGIGQPNVNGQILSQIKIPFAPLAEQSRIVARLEELLTKLDAGVESLKKAHLQIERYRQAVLKAAVMGEHTREWREAHMSELEPAKDLLAHILQERRAKWEADQLAKMLGSGRVPKNDEWKKNYEEPVSPDMRIFPALPEKWTVATWNQISNWVTYGFTRPMPHVEEGIAIVTAKNVNNRKIDLSNTHKTPRKHFEKLSEKDRPQKGDILITKDGAIGRAGVVETEIPFCINQSVAVVWLRTCPIERKFLLYVIESPYTQKPIEEKARGVAIQHLSITDFAKLTLPLPPLAEQRQIVEEVERALSIADATEQIIEQGLKQADRLRQSILHQAFAGKLVPQDPVDEPAETLLLRIRAERAQNGSAPRRTRRPVRNQKQATQPDLLP